MSEQRLFREKSNSKDKSQTGVQRPRHGGTRGRRAGGAAGRARASRRRALRSSRRRTRRPRAPRRRCPGTRSPAPPHTRAPAPLPPPPPPAPPSPLSSGLLSLSLSHSCSLFSFLLLLLLELLLLLLLELELELELGWLSCCLSCQPLPRAEWTARHSLQLRALEAEFPLPVMESGTLGGLLVHWHAASCAAMRQCGRAHASLGRPAAFARSLALRPS